MLLAAPAAPLPFPAASLRSSVRGCSVSWATETPLPSEEHRVTAAAPGSLILPCADWLASVYHLASQSVPVIASSLCFSCLAPSIVAASCRVPVRMLWCRPSASHVPARIQWCRPLISRAPAHFPWCRYPAVHVPVVRCPAFPCPSLYPLVSRVSGSSAPVFIPFYCFCEPLLSRLLAALSVSVFVSCLLACIYRPVGCTSSTVI